MSPDEQLDAILGECLKALVDSGAGASFLGGFTTHYRDRFAQHLGVSTQQAPDLKGVIADAVTQAVQKALGEQGDRGSAKDKRVRITVMCGGKRTSVSVRQSRLDQISVTAGSIDESNRIVREIAAGSPAEVENRSQWVEDHIDAYLQLRNQEPTASVARH